MAVAVAWLRRQLKSVNTSNSGEARLANNVERVYSKISFFRNKLNMFKFLRLFRKDEISTVSVLINVNNVDAMFDFVVAPFTTLYIYNSISLSLPA